MKRILGLPLYHVHNVCEHLIPDLQTSIEKIQEEKHAVSYTHLTLPTKA